MNRKETLGASCLLLTLQFFVVQGVVQAAWTTPFSLAHNMISDLARETCGPLPRAPGIDYACSPWHALMNLSIALNGILIPVGIVLTRRLWSQNRVTAAALLMIVLTGPGHVLVAGWPSDTGPTKHLIGAGSILALGNPGMVVAGFGSWRAHRSRARASLALGITGILGTLLFLGEIGAGIGLGGMERVAFYPITIWCGVQGFALLKRTRQPDA